MNKLGYHIQHYLPLLGIFILGICGFIFFPYDAPFQIALTLAVASGYVCWGVVHHYIHGDLKPYVFFEYLCIALIGVFIVYSLLFF